MPLGSQSSAMGRLPGEEGGNKSGGNLVTLSAAITNIKLKLSDAFIN